MATAIITLIILIFVNAFFAASELAFVNVNDSKVRNRAERGDKKAKKLYTLISKPSHFFSTIQIGITMTGFLSSAFAADFFAGPVAQFFYQKGVPIPLEILNTISIILITMVLAYFSLVLGELVPKQLALHKAEEISILVVGPISLLAKVFFPIVKFLTFSTNTVVRLFGVDPNARIEEATEEDIRMLVDIGEEKGTIDEDEKYMINKIFELDDKEVSDIATHRTDIAAISMDTNLDDIIEVINANSYTRYPVYEGNLDTVVGILHVKDLFRFMKRENTDRFNLKMVMRKPTFVLESQKIDMLFSEMRLNNIHIAIVLDEFGGTEGLVTIEDVIEEIVGDISSESLGPGFYESEVKQIATNKFEIKGIFRLWELEDVLQVKLPTDEFDTVNGFLISKIGYIPKEEDCPIIHYKNLSFEVIEVADNRIETVVVTVMDEAVK